jgi:hypothetical protein
MQSIELRPEIRSTEMWSNVFHTESDVPKFQGSFELQGPISYTPSQITICFGFSRYTTFDMHLDILCLNT